MPKGVKAFEIVTTFSDAHGNHYYNYSPCSFAFVAWDKYTFRQSYLQDLQKRTNYPMVLDWAIGDTTCEEAKKNGETYACKSENSECYNSTNGGGYRCRCYGVTRGTHIYQMVAKILTNVKILDSTNA
ncbi:hypothetical protein GH714_014148 [Hevea brasiliensis]|uniref:Wall-associated receptor kinase domain-containing protein n=1 Tax=Hevea brasiliensis TaxID=3981 RepID=A0A6A6L6H8_HEVBR|nr:hypothetical protein GH714_014148 [Hevea brasiliensis]